MIHILCTILTQEARFMLGERKIGRAVLSVAVIILCARGIVADDSRYLDYVKVSFDTLIAKGRDRYGEETSPLFAANLNVKTLECVQEPADSKVVHVRLRRDRRRSPGGSNQYFDQATFRAMDVVSRITGEPIYRQEALKALKFNLNHAVDPQGLPALGGHTFWNFYTDKLDCNGHYDHEFWNWAMAWDLWWEADPDAAWDYAELMWEWHVCDKESGEVNRHSDKKAGWPFPFMAGNFIEGWAKAYDVSDDERFKQYAEKVGGYYWNIRNRKTDLVTAGGVEKGRGTRKDANYFAMGGTTVLAYYLIKSGRMIDSQQLENMGRAYLDAYAKYGYDGSNKLFYCSLTLEGEPIKPDAARGYVDGQTCVPSGYCATWQPYCGWYELPLPVAQIYAWASEEVDAKYLDTAKKWGDVIRISWDKRYGGYESWSRYREALDADRELVNKYKTIDYPYTAPYGLYADHYGRVIQFALSMYRLTDDKAWQDFARAVADDAVRVLWKGEMFVGHPGKSDLYENCDNVGMLLYSLVQLHVSLQGINVEAPVML